MTEKSTVTLKPSVLIRLPCNICGGVTEKNPVCAETEDGLCVCERCLEERDFDAALEAYAKRLEREARRAHSMIGRIEAPTYAEWLKALDDHAAEFMAELRQRDPERAAEMDKGGDDPF